MTPLASVAMLEKLALLKIALCKAPVVSRASGCPAPIFTPLLGVRRSEPGVFTFVTKLPFPPSCSRHVRWRERGLRKIVRGVRPDAERLEGVLRDEAAVLAHD